MEKNKIVSSVSDLLSGYQWEIYISSVQTLKVVSGNLSMESLTKSKETGVGIRIKKGEKTGFFYISNPTEEKINKAVQKAIQSIEISEDDPYIQFSSPTDNPVNPEIYDKYFAENLSDAEKSQIALEFEEKIRSKDSRITNIRNCSFIEKISEYTLINSNGVEISEKSTAYTIMAAAIATGEKDSQIAWGFDSSRFLSDLNVDKTAEEMVHNAVSLLGAKPIPSQVIPALFPPYAFTQILEAFFPVFSGESLITGKTYLKDKLQEKIAPDFLTLIDSGLLSRKVGSRKFDDEGTPTQSTEIIKNGVFQTFLHSIYTANKTSSTPTGNGFRNSFKDTPSVQPSNFYLSNGSQPVKPEGKYFKVIEMMGLHTANPVTGDFSVGATGLLIQDGYEYPVSGITISGNFFELLGNIVQIGNDLKFYGRFGSPSVFVSRINIGGD
ncbi:TldD/PmbA family protein [Persephonella sp.]|uniref:TldD/PmbA family protein n=1 Tax=Persephonella sp. TaxID=2060922 RepID=UPI00261AF141|nr:TldD/PmbA family protein [Persephonella sp.]